jgi:hypothetical protein
VASSSRLSRLRAAAESAQQDAARGAGLRAARGDGVRRSVARTAIGAARAFDEPARGVPKQPFVGSGFARRRRRLEERDRVLRSSWATRPGV